MSEGTSPEELKQTVATLAEALGERTPQVQWQLRRVVRHIGPERARAFLAQAQEVEAQGGLLTKDESRRRTPGGTFFHVVRESLSPEEQRLLFPWNKQGKKQRKRKKQQAAAAGSQAAEALERSSDKALEQWQRQTTTGSARSGERGHEAEGAGGDESVRSTAPTLQRSRSGMVGPGRSAARIDGIQGIREGKCDESDADW
ncbi:MAG: hypothetical protein H0T73_18200 [Ardenticatenales bacterium]|nr:hypothetical protein [Ardenticatenales bacterium]